MRARSPPPIQKMFEIVIGQTTTTTCTTLYSPPSAVRWRGHMLPLRQQTQQYVGEWTLSLNQSINQSSIIIRRLCPRPSPQIMYGGRESVHRWGDISNRTRPKGNTFRGGREREREGWPFGGREIYIRAAHPPTAQFLVPETQPSSTNETKPNQTNQPSPTPTTNTTPPQSCLAKCPRKTPHASSRPM